MKRTMLSHALTVIGLLVWLYRFGGTETSQIVSGSTQGKQAPSVQLLKVEQPNEGGIDNRSFIVTLPAAG